MSSSSRRGGWSCKRPGRTWRRGWRKRGWRRWGPPDPLLPFADEALKALYEPGPSAKPSDIVRWDIGWLNKTFLRALDDHLTNLSTLAQQQSQRVEDLPPPQLVIGASAVRAARESLNQGQ
jgi:hypothetical protein